MPKITKVFSLDITPQQFIDNCSDVELKELELILFKNNNKGIIKIGAPSTHCNCDENDKTGTTTIQCCNICGLPDEAFWRSKPPAVKIKQFVCNYPSGKEKCKYKDKDPLACIALRKCEFGSFQLKEYDDTLH